MTFLNSATAVNLLAEGGEHHSRYETLNPWFIGGFGLFALLLLLWITTRFNRDR